MNVKFTFEQSVIAYVSLPQEAGSVYHALVRDHGEGCDRPSHSNQRGGRDHHHLRELIAYQEAKNKSKITIKKTQKKSERKSKSKKKKCSFAFTLAFDNHIGPRDIIKLFTLDRHRRAIYYYFFYSGCKCV